MSKQAKEYFERWENQNQGQTYVIEGTEIPAVTEEECIELMESFCQEEMENLFKEEQRNTSNSRAEDFLRKYKIHAATSRNVTFPSSDGKVYNLHELMEIFLDDKLSEIMHELKFSKRMEASRKYTEDNKLSESDAISYHHGIVYAFRIIRDKFWKKKNYDI